MWFDQTAAENIEACISIFSKFPAIIGDRETMPKLSGRGSKNFSSHLQATHLSRVEPTSIDIEIKGKQYCLSSQALKTISTVCHLDMRYCCPYSAAAPVVCWTDCCEKRHLKYGAKSLVLPAYLPTDCNMKEPPRD